MEGQFITNKELILSDIINSILPKCNNAYFLVGYFYFSGFAELYEKLKDVNLKVLVGLEVERSIINGIKKVENFTTSNKSRGQIREDFYKSLDFRLENIKLTARAAIGSTNYHGDMHYIVDNEPKYLDFENLPFFKATSD